MEAYINLALLVFVINCVPAFMPPTWLILAFFYTHYQLNLLSTVVLGAVTAVSGRIVLYYFARIFLSRFSNRFFLRNYQTLGQALEKYQNITLPALFAYAFLPVPSNHVYIAAGLAKVQIHLIALSFFLGRLLSYTLWITVYARTVGTIEGIFTRHLTNPSAILSEVLGFVLLFLVGLVNWSRALKLRR